RGGDNGGFIARGCSKADLLFFFSSRRRHTRSDRDWSSDVCSSDLKSFSTSLAAPIISPLNSSWIISFFIRVIRVLRGSSFRNMLPHDFFLIGAGERLLGADQTLLP